MTYCTFSDVFLEDDAEVLVRVSGPVGSLKQTLSNVTIAGIEYFCRTPQEL